MLPYVLIAGVYVVLRLIAFLHAGIRVLPDTGSYDYQSHQSLFSSSFYTGTRTWGLPLLYKLPGDGARAAGQLVVSICCWIALAAAVVRWMRRPCRLRLGWSSRATRAGGRSRQCSS